MVRSFVFAAALAIPIALSIGTSSPANALVPNDECVTATAIDTVPFVAMLDTLLATKVIGDPNPPCITTPLPTLDSSVWYTFTAVETGTLLVDTAGSDYDTVLSAYSGSCAAPSLIACNDDVNIVPPVVWSRLALPVHAGETIYLEVAAVRVPGNLKLNVAPHDAVVALRKPVTIKLQSGTSSVTKKVKVKVVNADPIKPPVPGQTIQLTATSTDCPSGTIIGVPDFDPDTDGAQNTVLLPSRKAAKAVVPITVQNTDFDTTRYMAPTRCTLTFTANTVFAANNVDPSAGNNVMTVELNVVDKNDTQIVAPESFVKSLSPLKVKMRQPAALKVLPLKMCNAADREVGQDADVTVVTDDGDCPPGTIGMFNGGATNVSIAPSKWFKGPLSIYINGAALQGGNPLAPRRCTATVSTLSSSGDTDTSNNTTRLVISVVDD